LFLFPVFFSCCLCTELVPAIIEGPTKAPIGCHKRLYTYQIIQKDAKGYTCSDTVSVNACWGRCDSKEVSDWKFPFKMSHHPVCVHKGTTKVVIMLQNCDPDASPEARRYEYIEPVNCMCQICSSKSTSCESPQAIGKFNTHVRLVADDLEKDFMPSFTKEE
jgi:Cystine-knot domain